MSELTADDWRELAHLWRDLAELATSDVEQGWREMVLRLAALTSSDFGYLIIQRRIVDDPDDPIGGFRAVQTLYCGPDAERRAAIGAQWRKEYDYTADPVVRHLMARRGQLRVVRHIGDFGESWQGTPSWHFAQMLGLHDRMTGIVPLCDEVEVSIGLDRLEGKPAYDAHDSALLHAALDGLRPLAASLASSYGLSADQTKLSPREREVLSYLLGPLSEKEIADRIGLATSSTHQIVVAIYRKLGVRSRAELMSRWLDLNASA